MGATPLTIFHQLFWNFSDVFCMEYIGYNSLIIFFCFVNLVFFFSMKCYQSYRQWVPCGRNSSYSFPLIVLKLCRCFLHEMKILLIVFSHFFCFMNLVSFFFFTWNAIKVYRQWVPCGRNYSYSFALIVLKLCRCFLHGCACGFGIILGYFFFIVPIFSY